MDPPEATTMDPPGPAPTDSPGPTPTPTHDPSRRAFFLEFGRQAVAAAGQVAGVADIVNRASGGGLAELIGLGGPSSPAPASPRPFLRQGGASVVSAAAPIADDRYRSPYRVAGDELVLLDQRRIPDALEEVVARRGSDVAYYLRLGVLRGGPIAAQVAAYGLALTAAERAGQPADQRRAELRRTAQALASARPSLRLPAWAIERMEAHVAPGAAADADRSGDELAAALRAEADAIATDLAAWNAALTAALVERLSRYGAGGSLTVLLHGDHGPLHGGVVGTGLAALQRLLAEGRDVRVFVTEGRPFMDGARLACWELRQAGIEHRLIPDSAVAWLLAREHVDAVLVNAEWVAADGATAALIGARAIARLAADSGSRVIATGVTPVIDPAVRDGGDIPEELRPARDLTAYLAEVPVRASDVLVPASDVMPASCIDVLITERGAVRPGEVV